jgi:hypothetical protein
MEVGMDNDNQVTYNTSIIAQANINLWQRLKSEFQIQMTPSQFSRYTR